MAKKKEAGMQPASFSCTAERDAFSDREPWNTTQRLARDEPELFPDADEDPLDDEPLEELPPREGALLALPPSRRTLGE